MSREQQEYWDIQAWRHETEYFAQIERNSITHKNPPVPTNVSENPLPF